MAERESRKYAGTCHCGAIRFEIETDFPELTMCDCSICRRKLTTLKRLAMKRTWRSKTSVGIDGKNGSLSLLTRW